MALGQQVIGEAVITVGADATGFQRGLDSQVTSASKSAGSSFTSKFGSAVKGGALAVGATAVTILGVSLAKGFQRLKAIDDAEAKLRGLGHSAEDITAIMDNALASVEGTAFGLGDAASQAATLVAAGIKPGQELTDTLALLADTATIAGTGLSEMGGVFAKAAATGKVSNEIIGSLQDRGVPALKFIGDELGLTAQKTFDLVSQGKVNFETFAAAMEKGLGGAAQASGKTFSGGLANMQAALGRFGAALLGGVFDKMPDLFSRIITVIDSLAPVAENIGKVIGDAFSFVFELISSIASNPAVVDFFRQIGDAISSIFATKPSGEVQGAFESIARSGQKLLPALQDVFAGLSGVVGTVVRLVQRVAPLIAEVWTAVAPVIAKAVATILPIWGKMVRFVGEELLPIVGDLVAFIIEKFLPVYKGIADVIKTALPWIKKVGQFLIENVLPAVKRVAESFAENLKPIISQVADNLTETLIPAVQDIIEKLKQWWPEIEPVVSAIISFAEWVLKLAFNIIGFLAPILAKLAGPLIKGVFSAIGTLIDIAGTLIVVFKKVGEFIGKVAFAIYDFFTGDTFSGIIDWVQNTWSTIYEAVKEPISRVLNWVKENWPKIRAFIATALTKVRDFIKKYWPVVQEIFRKAMKFIQETVLPAFRKIRDFIVDVWTFIQEKIRPKIEWVVGKIQWLVDRARAIWNGLSWLWQKAQEIFNKVRTTVSEKIGQVMTTIRGLPDRIRGVFEGAVDWLFNIGRDIIQGLIDGIDSLLGEVEEKFNWVTDKIPDWKGPPSKDKKLLEPVGKLIMTGFVNSLIKGAGEVKKTLADLTRTLEKAGEDMAADVVARMDDRLIALGNRLEEVNSDLEKARQVLADRVAAYKATFDSLFDQLSTTDVFGATTTNALGEELPRTFQDITDGLTAAITETETFADLLAQLKRTDINRDLFRQLAEGGVESTQAIQEILATGDAGIARLNRLQERLTSSAEDAAKTTAEALYRAGIRTAEGVVDGLKKRKNQLEKSIDNLGQRLVDAIERAVDKTKLTGLSTDPKTVNKLINAINKNTEAQNEEGNGKRARKLAGGARNFSGGLAMVGEDGPELVQLPNHSRVIPATQTGLLLRGLPGLDNGRSAAVASTTVNQVSVTMTVPLSDLKQIKDIDAFLALLDKARVTSRKTLRSGTVTS